MSFLHVLEFGGVPKILPGQLSLEDVISFAEPEEEGSFYNSISTVMWFLLNLLLFAQLLFKLYQRPLVLRK